MSIKAKIGNGFLLVTAVLVSFSIFRNKHIDQITIVAFYNQYACGDDNIDMNVKRVDNPKYNFVIDKDIAPVTNFIRQRDLINFVNKKTLMWQQGEAGEYLGNFVIVGHFKDSKGNTDCSSAVDFVVDRIKYGEEEHFAEF